MIARPWIYFSLFRKTFFLQPNLVEALLAVAQYPCIVALEGMLEPLADGAVQAQEVVGSDALAIGRVGHHDGTLGRLHEVGHIAVLNGDVLGEARCTHIVGGDIHRLPVDVVAVDMVGKLALGRVVVVYLVEKLLVEERYARLAVFVAYDLTQRESDCGPLSAQGALLILDYL